MRSFIDFDFSSIPNNATILNATLSFSHYVSTSNVGHSTLSGSNACFLKRITSPWDEMTITWNNQPNSTSQNQVTIDASLNNNQNYLNINVTNLIQDIINNPLNSFGMMLVLQDENYYRSMLFSSSNNNDVNKRPKLTITYQVNNPSNDSCILITPNAENWKDAIIWNIYPSQNISNTPDFIACAWTNSGNLSIMRSLLKFEVPVPQNSTITSAKLSLYHYNSTNNVGHSTLSGSNSAYLRKIISFWDENNVNWNNKPNTTTTNQVYLPATTNNSQDYTNIDITDLVIDFYNNPNSNLGLMFMLDDENYYRSMLFASKDCNDLSKLPKIEICYHLNNNSINDIDLYNPVIGVFPNPAANFVNLNYDLKESCNVSFEILNILGQIVLAKDLGFQNKGKGSCNLVFDNNIEKGIYLIRMKYKDKTFISKFIKE